MILAIDWDLYTKRLNINGSTKRERDLNKLQNDIISKSVDSLSYKTVFINNIVNRSKPNNTRILLLRNYLFLFSFL
mgnify:CR=1 FL=1